MSKAYYLPYTFLAKAYMEGLTAEEVLQNSDLNKEINVNVSPALYHRKQKVINFYRIAIELNRLYKQFTINRMNDPRFCHHMCKLVGGELGLKVQIVTLAHEALNEAGWCPPLKPDVRLLTTS